MSRSGARQLDLSILRMNIEDHPLRSAAYNVRLAYMNYLYDAVWCNDFEGSLIDAYMQGYSLSLQISSEDFTAVRQKQNHDALQNAEMLKLLVKTHWLYSGGLSFSIHNYKYSLFVDETLLLQYKLKETLTNDHITIIAKKLKISIKKAELLASYSTHIFKQDDKAAALLLETIRSKRLLDSINFLYTRLSNQLKIDALVKVKVPVIATMSAGKSTFINAIIGDHLLPSRQQACTAKSIAIHVNPYIKHAFACNTYLDESMTYSGIAKKDTLAEWNESTDIQAIELEVPNACTSSSFILFDTPGSNFSQDSSHEKITEDVISSDKYKHFIYVLNACYLGTDDDRVLLVKLREKLVASSNSSILFVLNKIDELDLEGSDSLEESMHLLQQDLETLGFNNPKVIPTSAYAAKLFKLALGGQVLTKKELRELKGLMEQFSPQSKPSIVHSVVEVNGEKYDRIQLQQALKRTNIPYIEEYLGSLTK